MKILKPVFYAMVFLFGFTAMSQDDPAGPDDGTDCATVYTVCDNAHPEDYDLFLLCMERNGC